MASRSRSLARRLLPEAARPTADALAHRVHTAATRRLNVREWLREQRQLARMTRGSILEFRGHRIAVNDPPNVRVLCHDLFDNHIYGFRSEESAPRILDLGGNIGMSVIYFKDLYPAATIVALEPDPAIFPYLEENLRLNGLEGVELLQAAVAD